MEQQSQNITDKVAGLFKGDNWVKVTANIYTGVLIYQLGGVIHSILDPINSLSNAGRALDAFASGSNFSSGVGFLDVVLFLLSAAIICGYVIFLTGLKHWKPMLQAGDANAVQRVWLGVVLGLIATVLDMIPLMGWIAGLVNIVAFIMMLLGYNALKNSPTFPAGAKVGAGKLYTAMILVVVGAVVGFIPLVGGFIEMVLDIVAFFMVIAGWKIIKNTPAPVE